MGSKSKCYNIVKKMEDKLYQKVVQLYNCMCMVDTECHVNSKNFINLKKQKSNILACQLNKFK